MGSTDTQYSGETPVISALALVDSKGKVLSECGADPSQGESGSQSVNVSLQNVPSGALLMVQISAKSNPAPKLPATASATNTTAPTETTQAAASDRGTAAATESAAESAPAAATVPGTVTATSGATGTSTETQTSVASTSETESATEIAANSSSVSPTATNPSTVTTSVTNSNATTPSVPAVVATTPSTQSSNWALSFFLNIQLQVQTAPPPTSTSAQGQTAIGTLTVAPSGQPSTSHDSPESSTTESVVAANSGAAPTAALSNSSVSDQSLDLSDDFNERVPTGPLASRSASPLGPIIAASMANPTSPVDRHERALVQDVEGIGTADEIAFVKAGEDQSILLEDELQSSETDEDHGTVVVVSGRGGFPLKVTARPSGQRADLAALLTVLPDSSDSKRERPLASNEDLTLNQVSVALAAEPTSSTDSPRFPDYVKAAFGLAIGLALTSGPLFTDLMQSLRSRVPIWNVGRRARDRRMNSSE